MQPHTQLPDAPHPPQVDTGFVRRRCRNLRCGAKLKRETNNPRNAFCCYGCVEQYYRNVCLVCERPLRRKGRRPRRFCRQKCKSEFHRDQSLFSDLFRLPATTLPGAVRNGVRSAHSMGLKIGTKRDRPFRIVAGPAANLDPINLAVPFDPETAARVRRANATEIPTPTWPVILIGGSDHEHELVCRARKAKLKQEKVP
jgi:hypothetical protein